MASLPRRMFAEFIGAALLVAGVIGSGIAALVNFHRSSCSKTQWQ